MAISPSYPGCFAAQHGTLPEEPHQLRCWLQQAELYAEMNNPFFRGWLVRRLSEAEAVGPAHRQD